MTKQFDSFMHMPRNKNLSFWCNDMFTDTDIYFSRWTKDFEQETAFSR